MNFKNLTSYTNNDVVYSLYDIGEEGENICVKLYEAQLVSETQNGKNHSSYHFDYVKSEYPSDIKSFIMTLRDLGYRSLPELTNTKLELFFKADKLLENVYDPYDIKHGMNVISLYTRYINMKTGNIYVVYAKSIPMTKENLELLANQGYHSIDESLLRNYIDRLPTTKGKAVTINSTDFSRK